MENSYSEANSNTKIASSPITWQNVMQINKKQSKVGRPQILRFEVIIFSQKFYQCNITENLDINCRFHL